jgi:hypothetical protein
MAVPSVIERDRGCLVPGCSGRRGDKAAYE